MKNRRKRRSSSRFIASFIASVVASFSLWLVLRNVQVSTRVIFLGVGDEHAADTLFSHPSSIHHWNPIDQPNRDHQSPGDKKYYYYIIAPPEVTSDLISGQENSEQASRYYEDHLNEESAEMWLHRAFQQQSYEQGHTTDPSNADFFLIAGYLHLRSGIQAEASRINNNRHRRRSAAQVNHTGLIRLYQDLIFYPSKPHLMLIPTWNGNRGNIVGIKPLASALKSHVNLWSVGLERNEAWQGIGIDRIVPIPYVVRLKNDPASQNPTLFPNPQDWHRKKNSYFYAGDVRQNSQRWSGCFREQLILPLTANKTSAEGIVFDVQLLDKKSRWNQSLYNRRMDQNEFCLILCGDTPTSRSLTSAMVSGCIPVRVGSRLRGLCEPPCKEGFGWKISGDKYPHLPFPAFIPWDTFPEVNEEQFMNHGADELRAVSAQYDEGKKQNIKSIMHRVRYAWIYGWGNPVNTTDFGQVHHYLLATFQRLAFATV
eukprot:scaffold408_cov71-Cylindrotheca_fusiformis.AAC.11